MAEHQAPKKESTEWPKRLGNGPHEQTSVDSFREWVAHRNHWETVKRAVLSLSPKRTADGYVGVLPVRLQDRIDGVTRCAIFPGHGLQQIDVPPHCWEQTLHTKWGVLELEDSIIIQSETERWGRIEGTPHLVCEIDMDIIQLLVCPSFVVTHPVLGPLKVMGLGPVNNQREYTLDGVSGCIPDSLTLLLFRGIFPTRESMTYNSKAIAALRQLFPSSFRNFDLDSQSSDPVILRPPSLSEMQWLNY